MTSSTPPPSIQLIAKTDFTKQHIVSLALTPPLPPLTAPNTARIRTRTLALTTNNFTYAKLGGVPSLGWWDVWPTPPASSLPAPFNSDDTLNNYCRIPAWGYSEVLESTIPGLEAGTLLFGYQPISTTVETLELAAAAGDVPGHWMDVSARRGRLSPFYNLYISGVTGGGTKVSRGWDALMGVFFETARLLNRFVFSWATDIPPVHPLGVKALPWGVEDADVAGATVVVLAASGKTGLCFAHELRFGRPENERPARVVAVGSEKSRGFVRGTGLFDDVLLYGDLGDEGVDIGAKLGGERNKIVLVDFGARGDALDHWAKALERRCKRLQVLIVGGDPLATEQSETAKKTGNPESGVVRVFAGGLRERAVETVGAARYFGDHEADWVNFRDSVAERSVGLELKWSEGLGQVGVGWDALARGEYGPDVGLVYEV